MKALIASFPWWFGVVAKGEVRRPWFYLTLRIYKALYSLMYRFVRKRLCGIDASKQTYRIATSHPVAKDSMDHLHPFGTKNSFTNRAFVIEMSDRLEAAHPACRHSFLDLGCAGGQLVKDFLGAGWQAVGVEGSDYCRRHGLGCWPELDGKNLFTADITKPFQLIGGLTSKFDLITAWEVLEHIPARDLPMLFHNIRNHLFNGGYFIASTNSGSSKSDDGVELHQTRWTLSQWRAYMAAFTWLKEYPLDLALRKHVRITYEEPSFLYYRKVNL